MSLKFRLNATFAACALVPIVALGVFQGWSSWRSSLEGFQVNVVNDLEADVENDSRFFAAAMQDLGFLATITELHKLLAGLEARDVDEIRFWTDALGTVLRDFTANRPSFAELRLSLPASGQAVLGVVRGQPATTRGVGLPDGVARFTSQTTPAADWSFPGGVADLWLHVPVREEGLVGVLSARIDLAPFFALNRNPQISLLDERGEALVLGGRPLQAGERPPVPGLGGRAENLVVADQDAMVAYRRFVPIPWDAGRRFAVVRSRPRSEFLAPVHNTLIQVGLFCILAAAAAIGLGLGIIGSITRPILSVTGAMTRIADGDLGTEVPALNRKDEIGGMARAVQVFKDNAQAMTRLRGEQEAFKHQAEAERHEAVVALADNFEQSVRGIVDTVSAAAAGLEQAAATLATLAVSAKQRTETVAKSSSDAAANVGSVATAAEQLGASISEIGAQASRSAAQARTAAGEARRADGFMTTLTDEAQKIGRLVKLVQGIASQTNLLALNATIEAARAGEAGRGFTVVAGEVKTLAHEAAKVTEDITGQISAIQQATEQAVSAIHGIAQTVGQMTEISVTIASAVEQQGAATGEISRNVHQAAHNTGNVSLGVADVSSIAEQVEHAANAVLDSARSLAHQAADLRADVDAFIGFIRTQG